MTNFCRALRFAWPYRYRFALSVACALLVAVLWGGNLTAVFPIVTVFVDGRNLQSWIDEKVDRSAERIGELQQAVTDGDAELTRLAELQPTSELERERLAVAETLGANNLELTRAQRNQRGYERAKRFIHRHVPQNRRQTLALILFLMIAGLALKGVFIYFNESLGGGVTQLSMFDLKNRLYRHSMKMDLSHYNQQGSSEVMARFTNDMETLTTGINTLLGKVIREPLKASSCIVLACCLNWRLTLVVLGLVPVAVLIMSTIGRYMKRATRRCLESMSSIYRILQESFQGIKIVKAFTMEPYERRRFYDETRSYYRKSMRIVRLEAMTSPIMEMVGVAAISVAVFVGASLVMGENDHARTHVFGVKMADSPMDAQTLATLFTLLAGISDPVRKLSNVYGRVQRAEAAADRIFAFLDRESAIANRPGAVRLSRHRGSIELRDVEFSYTDSQPVLKGISLRVRAGETIALVGPNGCGKTTLLSLLPRFYDPQRGRVLIDDIDVRDFQLRSLRQQIGTVTQETVLFNDTILNNIRYGNRRASRDQIEAAARQAYAHGFIQELPDGYETVVGERAVKLSGGQRQRIALARAILREPAILILDEATSALDVESESLIQRALEEFVRGRTTFVITHRLSTLELANRIVVMDDGHIKDVGVHAELLRRCELYARLYEIHSSSRMSA